jgi:hypothetical protein
MGGEDSEPDEHDWYERHIQSLLTAAEAIKRLEDL